MLACISILLLLSACGDDKPPGNGNGNGAVETYAVSGKVTTSDGSGLAGVEINFSGGTATLTSVTTDADGAWQQSKLEGSVTVTPTHDDYRFDPLSTTVDAAATNVDFTAIATYTVSGLILDDDDDPLPGVEVQFAGENSPAPVHTDETGRWEGKHLDGEVVVTPVDPAYTFDSETRTVQDAASDIDFVGTMKECNAGDKVDPNDPCVVTRIKQVQNIQAKLDGHYALGDDVDARATEAWDDDAGFKPLGSQNATQFTGTFDGRDFEIRGLFIDRDDINEVGMFGYVGTSGEVSDLSLLDGAVHGRHYVGAVAGVSRGILRGIHSNTQVTGNERVGGIVGSNYATVDDAHNTGAIKGVYRVGGIVGANTDEITNASNKGAVQGDEQIGGIVGYSVDGLVDEAHNNGNITGDIEHVGGIVGLTEHSIIKSTSNGGTIEGVLNVGGVAGENRRDAAQPEKVSLVSGSHNSGFVIGDEYVGGVVGLNYHARTEFTYNEDDATVEGEHYVGGVVGRLSSGLVLSSYNAGAVTASGDHCGGVVGYNYFGAIVHAFNRGHVKGNDSVGGVAGTLDQSGARVTASYNVGPVEGGMNVGGIAGSSFLSTIENSYNLGNVSSLTGGRVGGVLAISQGAGATVEYTFSAGLLDSTGAKGGIAASDPVNSVTNSHFDKDIALGTVDEVDRGESSAAMMQEGTYTNWDFNAVWTIDEGNDYPDLTDHQR